MRFVVYGAGAVGGLLGGSLHESGHDVVLIARGPHLAAIQAGGLRMDTPAGSVTVAVPAVARPDEIELTPDDVVFLAMKSQHTDDALRTLAGIAPSGIAVVSVQNGVANEPSALRWFGEVYGMCVYCPATHLEPGVVESGWAPVRGILDIGRYPDGPDPGADAIAAAVGSTAFDSVARPDIMRWKYAKLLTNLSNAVDALCGPGSRGAVKSVDDAARAEGRACLAAAGIRCTDSEEVAARRSVVTPPPAPAPAGPVAPAAGPPAGRVPSRRGASSWQSLARGTGSIEADYLNGEIVMLGRQLGVPTPVNEALQRVANRAAREGWAAGSVSADALIRMVHGGE